MNDEDEDELSFGSIATSGSGQERQSPRSASPEPVRSREQRSPSEAKNVNPPKKPSIHLSSSPSLSPKPSRPVSRSEISDERPNRSLGDRAAHTQKATNSLHPSGHRSRISDTLSPPRRSRLGSPSYSDRQRDRYPSQQHHPSEKGGNNSGRHERPPKGYFNDGHNHSNARPPRYDDRPRGPPSGRRPEADSRNGHNSHRQRSLSPRPPSDSRRRDGSRYSDHRRDGPPPFNGGRTRDSSGGMPPPHHHRERPRHPPDNRRADGQVPSAGDVPGSMHGNRSRQQDDDPPHRPGPSKRAREGPPQVPDRIETVTADDGPPKRHQPPPRSNSGPDDSLPRPPRPPPGPNDVRGRGQDAGPPRRRAPSRWEAATPRPDDQGAGQEHPAEALRRAPDVPRPRAAHSGPQALPGPPPTGAPMRAPPPPPGGSGPAVGAAAPDQGGADFGLSGVLAADSKRNERGVVQKYAPPDDACIPTSRWRLYIYKGDPSTGDAAQQGQPITLIQGRKTYWIFGKDRSVCDIFALHGSISREHAVVQFKRGQNGRPTPYIMDLESVNGTHIASEVGSEKIEPLRYYRLMSQDIVRFGGSSRDYVFIDEDDPDRK